jgi:hypothetical protein
METYYHPHDSGKFAEMGKGNKDLWEKFMTYYSAVFAEGALTEREKAFIASPLVAQSNARTALMRTRRLPLKKGRTSKK